MKFLHQSMLVFVHNRTNIPNGGGAPLDRSACPIKTAPENLDQGFMRQRFRTVPRLIQIHLVEPLLIAAELAKVLTMIFSPTDC
jgi:hypothetical protein